jgi:hypothetical protein
MIAVCGIFYVSVNARSLNTASVGLIKIDIVFSTVIQLGGGGT